MHACDPVPTVMGLRLPARRAAGAPLKRMELISRGKSKLIEREKNRLITY